MAAFSRFFKVYSRSLPKAELVGKDSWLFDTYVSGDSVVPKNNSVRAPLDTNLIVSTLIDVVKQEFQDRIYNQ